jgi:hypothetical protein
MAVTKSSASNNDPYVAPSSMNADDTFDARPDQWGAMPTANPNLAPHSAYDEVQTWDSGAPSALAGGNYESTLDAPGGWGES